MFLKERFPDAEIFGIDSSIERIKAAKKQELKEVNFFTIESIILPFGDHIKYAIRPIQLSIGHMSLPRVRGQRKAATS